MKLAGLSLICAAALAGPALAQPPAATPTGDVAVAAPTYISIHMEVMVNKSAADAWKRVGKYCDLGEWRRIDCTIKSGKDGEFGAVRSIAEERVTQAPWAPPRFPTPTPSR